MCAREIVSSAPTEGCGGVVRERLLPPIPAPAGIALLAVGLAPSPRNAGIRSPDVRPDEESGHRDMGEGALGTGAHDEPGSDVRTPRTSPAEKAPRPAFPGALRGRDSRDPAAREFGGEPGVTESVDTIPTRG